jgi:hypothetical protein
MILLIAEYYAALRGVTGCVKEFKAEAYPVV